MKKIFFVAATLLALISTSCSNNGGIDVNDPKEYCWTLSVSISVLGQSETVNENVVFTSQYKYYFEDEESLKELGEMRYTDPERFYRIIRKEELFLNTCLQTFGFHNYIVSLNPDKLFG